MNKHELHPDRLATTDEHGHRIYLYPEDVKGFWKKRRDLIYFILIFIYLVLPWIQIQGKPFIKLDIFHREFTLFGLTWYGVEPILIFLSLLSFVFFIGFATSLFGRVWCGWACPQTVFIQSVFMRIERWIEGSARERAELDKQALTLKKLFLKSIKWVLFFLISTHIAHTFAGYFIGTHELLNMIIQGPTAHLGTFIFISVFTLILLIDFGIFREQFCIIACPYGRMQSVLMDENSIIVGYDQNRGEPRRGTVQKEMEGDCINCYHCVKVCPTGIDIRRGTQLECIACTLCIDACDEIMDKIKKPQGLIKYTSENELKGGSHHFITKRSLLYISISLLMFSSLVYFISQAGNLQFHIYRGTEKPYQIIKDESGLNEIILNHLTVKVVKQGEREFQLTFKTENHFQSQVSITTSPHPLKIKMAETKTPLFFKFKSNILKQGHLKIKINAFHEDVLMGTFEVPLVGPME